MPDATISRVNWNTLFAGGGVLLTIVGSIGWLAMQAIVLPMKAQLDGMASQLGSSDIHVRESLASQREIMELKTQITTSKIDMAVAVTNARLVEIETQKRGDAQSRNIQWASQLRWDALLFEKCFKSRFPSEIQYYPDISTGVVPPSK